MKLAEERELSRLLAEDAPSPSLVSALRERGPDATELASLASRLALQGIDVTPPQTAATPSPWKKWAAGGAGSVAVVVAWLALRGPVAEAPKPSSVAASPPSAVAAQAVPVSSAGVTTAPGAAARRVAVGGEPDQVAATPPAAAKEAGQPPADAPPSEPARALGGPAPIQRAERSAPATSEPPSSSAGVRSSEGAPSKGAAPGFMSPPNEASAVGGPTEIELLRDARLALRQSPARALELAEQHARLYPGGKLTQERELMAVSALVALGRRTAALARAERFDAAFPTSPYRKQIADLLR